jgi:hypothetical protein
MPTARASRRAERVAILDGDVRALTATARTASIPTRGRISSNRTLVAQRGRKAVARHRRCKSHGPPRSGDPLSRTRVPGPACRILFASAPSSRAREARRQPRASAGVLAAGPVTGSLLLQRPLCAPGDTSAGESPGLETGASEHVPKGLAPSACEWPRRVRPSANACAYVWSVIAGLAWRSSRETWPTLAPSAISGDAATCRRSCQRSRGNRAAASAAAPSLPRRSPTRCGRGGCPTRTNASRECLSAWRSWPPSHAGWPARRAARRA